MDRVLVPMRKLKEAGWSYGVIGIEAKRSDIKIGPAISQCLDYGRSLFELAGGVRVGSTGSSCGRSINSTRPSPR